MSRKASEELRALPRRRNYWYYGYMKQCALAFLLLPGWFVLPLHPLDPPERNTLWIPAGPVREIEEFILRENAEAVPVQRARFSETHRIREIVRLTPDPSRPITQTFAYDEHDRLIRWEARDVEDTMLWGYRYRYTAEGRLMQETEFNRNGEIAGNRAFLYYQDDAGLRTEESAYDAAGDLLWWMQRVRKTDAPEEEWTMYYPDGRVITEGVRRFDYQDRVIHEEEIDRATGKRTVTVFHYNRHDVPVHVEHFDSAGRMMRRETFEYDRWGNPLVFHLDTPLEQRRLTRRYHYQYDQYGNWTRRIMWRIVTENETFREIEQITRERRFTYRD